MSISSTEAISGVSGSGGGGGVFHMPPQTENRGDAVQIWNQNCSKKFKISHPGTNGSNVIQPTVAYHQMAPPNFDLHRLTPKVEPPNFQIQIQMNAFHQNQIRNNGIWNNFHGQQLQQQQHRQNISKIPQSQASPATSNGSDELDSNPVLPIAQYGHITADGKFLQHYSQN